MHNHFKGMMWVLMQPCLSKLCMLFSLTHQNLPEPRTSLMSLILRKKRICVQYGFSENQQDTSGLY